MTSAPGSIGREVATLGATGTEVLLRTPEKMDLDTLMDPAACPTPSAMGRRQAAADAADLRSFLNTAG